MLSCAVFGNQPNRCQRGQVVGGHVNTLVDEVLNVALSKESDSVCEGLDCVVSCAKLLGCLDHEFMGKCLNLKESKENCAVDCSTAKPSASSAWAIALTSIVAATVSLSPLYNRRT